MTPIATPDVVGWWLGAIKLALAFLGLGSLLRTQSGRRQPMVAVFAMIGMSGATRLLQGIAPDRVLITIDVLAFAAAIFWFVRLRRAQKARALELRSQRGQLRS